MTEDDLTPPRAVAIGIPARLRTDVLAHLPGVVLVDSLREAAAVLDVAPRAVVIYGEVTFGAVVSGQPVFVLPNQADTRVNPQVMILIDESPERLKVLDWDDPRTLAAHAGIRLGAGHLVDVSHAGTWGALNELLDTLVAEPPTQGVPSGDGNDEPNGDPDGRDQPPAAKTD